MLFSLRPIGTVRGGRAEPIDDRWGGVRAAIELDPALVPAEATLGLDAFSHLEVVYGFHLVDEPDRVTGSRRPRGREDWPLVGGLAQRNKDRVNRLGVSRCELVAVAGLRVEVASLDAVDGTPVFDVKPWIDGFAPRGVTRQPHWADELMADYYAPEPDQPGRSSVRRSGGPTRAIGRGRRRG